MASKAFLQQAYLAYFGRPADVSGLAYYADQSEAQVKAAFSASAESQAFFGSMAVAAQVNAIYNNLFNRDADVSGLQYWVNVIGSGKMSLADAAMGILAGAINDDKTAVANKLAASEAFTAALDTTAEVLGYAGTAAIAPARAFLAAVSATEASLAAAIAGVDAAVVAVVSAGSVVAGQTFTLTAGLDIMPGLVGSAGTTSTAGNDTINSNIATGLSALDNIDGGTGTDTLNIFGVDKDGAAAAINIPTTATVKNIEVANVTGAGAVTVNASGWTGLTDLNLKQAAGAADITASATTAVSTAGTSDAIAINGGKNVTVSDTTNNKNIDIGATTGPAGTITVTDTKQGTGTIKIDGGTNVTLTASSQTTATTGVITIGNTTKPTGEVNVTSNLSNAAAAATAMAGGVITVNGGTTVNVTQTATQAVMATASTNSTTTQSKVVVNGGAATTNVTVNQTAAVAAVDTGLAVAAVNEVNTVVFSALAAGQTAVLNGLTFKAGADGTTAAQTAAAFANLVSGTTQGNSTMGTYEGVFTAGWTGAGVTGASNNTVVFTATTAGPKADLVAGGTGTNPVVTETTAGVAAVLAAGKGGIANGLVQITDAAYSTASANSISSVTIDGYAGGVGLLMNAGVDNFIKSSALTTLTLSNAAGGSNLGVGNETATSLALNLNKVGAVGAAASIGLDSGTAGKYSTLNISTSGANSVANITAGGVKTLTVAGDKALDLTGSTLTVLETVTVSGAAGLTVDASGGTVTAVSTSTSTGTSVVSIDASKATYTGGTGVDNVTLSSSTVSKAISLGAGNDKVTLANGTTAVTGSINGGDGTDTLVMRAEDAATADDTNVFASKVTGFEVLSLTGTTGTIDLAQLGNYSQVESAASGAVTLNKMASGGSLTLTAAGGGYTVNVTDAADGTADVLNLGLKSSGALAGGTVTVADVETINLTSTDTNTTAHTNTLVLTADKATTVSVSGNAALTLTLTGSTKITSLDASAMTAALTVTSMSTGAVTITGGTGSDALTAATGTVAHTLIGGAGADTLTSNAGLSVLTGGAGNDIFVIQAPGANVNVYTTITDFTAGDRLVLKNQGVEAITTTKLTLGDTAVFQDYANLAASGDGSINGIVKWFQFAGNTYVVQDLSASTSFANGTDIIVKLTGLVDLSTASLNNVSSGIASDGAALML